MGPFPSKPKEQEARRGVASLWQFHFDSVDLETLFEDRYQLMRERILRKFAVRDHLKVLEYLSELVMPPVGTG
ncbi:hypothetical protein LMG27198_01290 [Methylocystis echinoides]|uniref:Uncharacterized protein n=1 Tax=Methylocystis echinoides TaxID=29468 RepID=A0A9W6GQ68_9HYPH|nr:hypothetical protein LMG27198_01290 [Methylocystis echinoides]